MLASCFTSVLSASWISPCPWQRTGSVSVYALPGRGQLTCACHIPCFLLNRTFSPEEAVKVLPMSSPVSWLPTGEALVCCAFFVGASPVVGTGAVLACALGADFCSGCLAVGFLYTFLGLEKAFSLEE